MTLLVAGIEAEVIVQITSTVVRRIQVIPEATPPITLNQLVRDYTWTFQDVEYRHPEIKATYGGLYYPQEMPKSLVKVMGDYGMRVWWAGEAIIGVPILDSGLADVLIMNTINNGIYARRVNEFLDKISSVVTLNSVFMLINPRPPQESYVKEEVDDA